jgi:hypothetical protein
MEQSKRIEEQTLTQKPITTQEPYYQRPIAQEPYYRPITQETLYQRPISQERIITQKENIVQPQLFTEGEYRGEYKQGYLTQQTVVTQLPGVISNPPIEEAGKYVVHQGGTHSQVGTVQAHRIISKMADKPRGTSADLDNEARIAMGDVPQPYYENK